MKPRPLTFVRFDTDYDLTQDFRGWLRKLGVKTIEVEADMLERPPELVLMGAEISVADHLPVNNPELLRGSTVVILDDELPDQRVEGIFCISTEDITSNSAEWKRFLKAIGDQIQMFTLAMRSEELVAAGAKERPNLDYEELEEGKKQADIERMDRFVNNFARKAGTAFMRLVDAQDYQDATGQAFVAAVYADDRARLAAERAREEMGKHFSHTSSDENGRSWGRIHWTRQDIIYEGETDGLDAHGHGVMSIAQEGVSQSYSGQFIQGVRCGFGVGEHIVSKASDTEAAQTIRWCGAWFDDQPSGYGVILQGKEGKAQDIKQGEVILPPEKDQFRFLSSGGQRLWGRRKKAIIGG